MLIVECLWTFLPEAEPVLAMFNFGKWSPFTPSSFFVKREFTGKQSLMIRVRIIGSVVKATGFGRSKKVKVPENNRIMGSSKLTRKWELQVVYQFVFGIVLIS